jgi:hypothetical protein
MPQPRPEPMIGPADLVTKLIEETIQDRDKRSRGQEEPAERYIRPSSLARGCMLYLAFELRGEPKPPLGPRVSRILQVGTDSHRRIEGYLGRSALAREVFFQEEEHRIRGYCDAIVYLTPEQRPEHAGFYAVEIKTTADSEFQDILAEGAPREEHVRQCQVYMWGITRYYKGTVPLKGGVILYENRDTLAHHAFDVAYDEEMMQHLLARVKTVWACVAGEELPDDYLPREHRSHRLCPYLDICEPGQKAVAWQKEQGQGLPDRVLAGIIADRVVAKQRREREGKPKQKGRRSLEALAEELGWA